MKFFSVIFLLFMCKTIVSQSVIINTSDAISDFIIEDNTIIASTLKGTIETYSLKTKKLISKINFPEIKDFTGDNITAEVFKIIKLNNTIYAIVHGYNGFNDIYKIVYSNPIKIFEGNVISIRGGGISKTFTVRKVSSGVGVERIFPLSSPKIAKVEIVREGKVRRAKLYYLRNLAGKAARIKDKNVR